MSKIDLSSIPSIGWVVIFVLGFIAVLIIGFAIMGIFYLILKKNIKSKIFEITDIPQQQQRELFIAEGKDQLENQCQVAKQLLKKVRIRIYEAGIEQLKIQDHKDIEIFELITYRIADRLNYDVRNDLTRNHITKKTDEELKEYSNAKAKGYYYMMYDRLYNMNSRLPDYELPKTLELIPESEIKAIFYEIYHSARSIAGGNGGKDE